MGQICTMSCNQSYFIGLVETKDFPIKIMRLSCKLSLKYQSNDSCCSYVQINVMLVLYRSVLCFFRARRGRSLPNVAAGAPSDGVIRQGGLWCLQYGDFQQWGVPQCGRFMGEDPFKMDFQYMGDPQNGGFMMEHPSINGWELGVPPWRRRPPFISKIVESFSNMFNMYNVMWSLP